MSANSREEYAAMVLNPSAHVQTQHRSKIDKLFTLSRQLVQAVWYRYEVLQYGRKTQNPGESDKTNKPRGEQNEEDRDGQGGQARKYSSYKIDRYFTPNKRASNKGFYAENPNDLAADQLICNVLNCNLGLVVGAVTTQVGRVIIWRLAINQDTDQPSELDWNNALILMSDDAMCACVISTMNLKNAAKVNKLLTIFDYDKLLNTVAANQLSALATVRCWPTRIREELLNNWRNRQGHWPKNGARCLGEEGDEGRCLILLVWIKDCPPVRTVLNDDAEYLNAVYVTRENFPMSKSISQVDKRRVEEEDNWLGSAKRFMDLDTDLERLDDNTRIVNLPSEGSSSSQIEQLEVKLRQQVPDMFTLFPEPGNCVDIPSAPPPGEAPHT